MVRRWIVPGVLQLVLWGTPDRGISRPRIIREAARNGSYGDRDRHRGRIQVVEEENATVVLIRTKAGLRLK